jgi:putative transposase
VLWNQVRVEVGKTMRTLVEHMDAQELVEGTLCPDHVHICLRIAPKHSAGKVVGKIKGRSAITPSGRHPEWRDLTGRDRTFWARGYYAGTVGLNEMVIRQYIKNQEDGSKVE